MVPVSCCAAGKAAPKALGSDTYPPLADTYPPLAAGPSE